MLFKTISPLLSALNLSMMLNLTDDGRINLTISPTKKNPSDQTGKGDLRPICLTGTAEELDAEFAKGESGALGKLIIQRKSLSDQLLQAAVEEKAAKDAAEADRKNKKPASKPANKPTTSSGSKPAVPTTPISGPHTVSGGSNTGQEQDEEENVNQANLWD